MKSCRIENFHFHDLRHTFAPRLVQSGIDLYKVQCLLEHKSSIMTQRYAHHYPESLRKGVEILARYSLPSTGRGTNLAYMAQTEVPALATSGVSC
jgi:integrase